MTRKIDFLTQERLMIVIENEIELVKKFGTQYGLTSRVLNSHLELLENQLNAVELGDYTLEVRTLDLYHERVIAEFYDGSTASFRRTLRTPKYARKFA